MWRCLGLICGAGLLLADAAARAEDPTPEQQAVIKKLENLYVAGVAITAEQERELVPRQVSNEGLRGSRIRENAGDVTRILTNAATPKSRLGDALAEALPRAKVTIDPEGQ